MLFKITNTITKTFEALSKQKIKSMLNAFKHLYLAFEFHMLVYSKGQMYGTYLNK